MGIYIQGGKKVGGMYMADGRGNATKVGGMYYADGKGNATKIYPSMYPNSYVVWQSSNNYGIALGGSQSDSPYFLSGNALQFYLNQKRIKNGIKIYVNTVNYYGVPYTGNIPIWNWNASTVPGGYTNSYPLPTQIVEIPLSNFNAQNILYQSGGHGSQASVYVSVNSQGVVFQSTYGGTIFDIPTFASKALTNGCSAILIIKIEVY